MKLVLEALIKFLLGIAMTAGVLLWPAGDWAWPGAWRFMALLFVPMLVVGVVLFVKSPELLKKRLNGREKERAQKGVALASALIFLVSFLLSGLDYRFSWTKMPLWLIWAGCILLLAAYGLYARVMQENAYLSRTIEIQENQRLVDTGLYALVRHPMYLAAIWLFLSVPLVLGSWAGFGVMLLYPPVLIVRIREEETLLKAELPGYTEYMGRVKYRLIPFIW